MAWEQVGVIAAVVIPVAGAAAGYMRLAMSNAIRGLKLDLTKELNGTYIRRAECSLQHGDLADRVVELERVSRANAGRDYHARHAVPGEQKGELT
jgi:predicted O-methyltransferase YrrM